MSRLDFVPYEVRYKYPGMAPLDKAIWERFVEANPLAFEKVAYHVLVGGGTEMNTVVNPETGGDVNNIYQRKIDVVGFNKGTITVIEVKPRASTSAIGQVEGYASLLVRDYDVNEQVNSVILTDELLPDVEFVAKEKGIAILVV